MRLSKRWKIVLGSVSGALIAFCLVFAIALEWASRHVREIVMKSLQEQFHGQVTRFDRNQDVSIHRGERDRRDAAIRGARGFAAADRR